MAATASDPRAETQMESTKVLTVCTSIIATIGMNMAATALSVLPSRMLTLLVSIGRPV
mgnify:CR=1 FL=1